MSTTSKILNAMTVDVEDYFHVNAFKHVIPTGDWDKWPCRVVKNTQLILELFEQKELKATFFVLGWVAERYPELVREIDQAGHEVASHGYSHQLVFNQERAVFYQETKKSKQMLEDTIGKPVQGYRAASYSITNKSLWALDVLAELGFTWDSSIFPIHHDTYGIASSPEEPYTLTTLSGAKLIEFPLTTAKVLGLKIPAAGGGYFRQYPYFLSRWLFRQAGEAVNKPAIFYLHPWEVDPEQPRIPNAGWKSNFRHYTNLSKCQMRLAKLIDDVEFTSMGQVLTNYNVSLTMNLSPGGLIPALN